MRRVKKYFSKWQNAFAFILVILFISTAVAAPVIAPPNDPENRSMVQKITGFRQSSLYKPYPPTEDFPLGSVPGGYDVFFSLIWGTRSAFRIGMIIALSTSIIGIILGAISGYAGGWINQITLRITDAFLTFPAIAGVFLFSQFIKPITYGGDIVPLGQFMMKFNISPVMATLILFSWMPYTRIINASINKLKTTEYALAARVSGAQHLRIIFKHLLPNCVSSAIVMAARDIGAMVLLDAAFHYIGVGGTSIWGMMLTAGKDWIIGPGGNPLTYWWVYLPITITLIFFGIGWNLLGDGLNDLLNPRSV